MIEVVITVVLMSIVLGAILQSVVAGIKSSSTSHSAAQVETALVNAADRVNRATKRCDYTGPAQAAVQTQGWDKNRVSVVNEYYIPADDAGSAGSWTTGPNPIAPGCPGLAPTDLLVQRVTIKVTSPNGAVSRTIQVVKSDV